MELRLAHVIKVKKETWTEARSYYGLRFEFNGMSEYRVLLGMKLLYFGSSMREALDMFNAESEKKQLNK